MVGEAEGEGDKHLSRENNSHDDDDSWRLIVFLRLIVIGPDHVDIDVGCCAFIAPTRIYRSVVFIAAVFLAA